VPTDIAIRCSCGAVRGIARDLSSGAGNRGICYCDDCQAFAHFLGRAEQILDSHGGTDIFQTSPARIEITGGREHLACMRLTPKGLIRWYTDCCRTPIGNTLATHQVPFIGLIVFCLDGGSERSSLDAALGPVRMRIEARFAVGQPTGNNVYDRMPLSMLPRIMGRILMARLRGDHKRSPFFNPQTGAPVSAPHILRAS
jgi:Family of unknown function (DUF6151)